MGCWGLLVGDFNMIFQAHDRMSLKPPRFSSEDKTMWDDLSIAVELQGLGGP